MRRMVRDGARGSVAYFAGWLLALVPVSALLGQLVVAKAVGAADGSETWWLLGAAAGAVLAVLLALATRRRAGAHLVLEGAGIGFVVLGLAAAAWGILAAGPASGGHGSMAGWGRFYSALAAVVPLGVGAPLWWAGRSGRRRLAAKDARPGRLPD